MGRRTVEHIRAAALRQSVLSVPLFLPSEATLDLLLVGTRLGMGVTMADAEAVAAELERIAVRRV